ncbi:YkvA family protein [Vreelandella subglaciescola]|uniref:Uncharacterized membrane protein YkvA, DUF1232 family n=1 Tax=Vreelandella subglaciescola TaxID=29571 RepID=A0A1M7F5V0_9GAMM|nr:YkvA family protein [Halomonas subglaciescola]SHL99138.1 Uncharacterized membrane protein YkvA, DUF1232 family [Halomonas subglaciescola]
MSLLTRWGWLSRLKSRTWAFKRMARGLRLFIPMTNDVLRGRFRPVPWKAFAIMVAAVGYLLLPFDLIPDFIVLFGVLDDVVIVGWLLNRIDAQLEPYRAWRLDKDPTTHRL